MAKAKDEGHPRRSTGNVVEPGDGFISPGVPDLSPAAGYDAARPVQYADESDTMFNMRLAEFEEAEATAKEIQSASGGTQDSLESRRLVLEKRRAKEDAALEAEEKALKARGK